MEQSIQTIKISELFPNPWNTNTVAPDNQAKIEASIKRYGMFKPLICRTLDDGRLQIVGGEHRWEAAKAVGIQEVPIVNLGKIDDKRAKEISLIDNSRYGTDDSLKLAEVLKELDDVSEVMPISNKELEEIFSATTIDLDALDKVEEEADEEAEETVEELTKSKPTTQVMRFKVPVADAEFVQNVINGICKLQGFTGSDSLTNAGDALVFLCHGARDEK
nr:MAG TPA: ParB protein [Caudoviricetes sp.]